MKWNMSLFLVLCGFLSSGVSGLLAQEGTCEGFEEIGEKLAENYGSEQRKILEDASFEAMTNIYMGAYASGFKLALDMMSEASEGRFQTAKWYAQSRMGTFQIEFRNVCKENPHFTASRAAMTAITQLAERYGPVVEVPNHEE